MKPPFMKKQAPAKGGAPCAPVKMARGGLVGSRGTVTRGTGAARRGKVARGPMA